MKQDKNMVALYVDKDTVNIYKASLDLYEALKNIQSGLDLNQNNNTTDSLQYVIRASLAIINMALAKAEK